MPSPGDIQEDALSDRPDMTRSDDGWRRTVLRLGRIMALPPRAGTQYPGGAGRWLSLDAVQRHHDGPQAAVGLRHLIAGAAATACPAVTVIAVPGAVVPASVGGDRFGARTGRHRPAGRRRAEPPA